VTMTKKKQTALICVLLLIFCLATFVACSRQAVKLEEYMANGDQGVANLNWVGRLVKAMHGWIGVYGWTVVVFTVFLKIAMIPFDLWQRVSMKKTSMKMKAIQPLIEDIDKRYANDKRRADEEKRKIYQKQSVSTLSSCLPMILTMVIFFVMFSGLTNYATYNSVVNYDKLQTFYNQQFQKAHDEYYDAKIAEGKTEVEAEEFCKDLAAKGNGTDEYVGIGKYYEDNVKESFLWIANIWQPDTWASVMPDYKTFTATVVVDGDNPKAIYDIIRNEVLATHTRGNNGNWNGLMILPILSIGLSFLSIFVSQNIEKRNRKGEDLQTSAQQAGTNKMMMILMPLMMAIFGFTYTGAFAIYMVVNYSLSIISTIALRVPSEKIAEKRVAADNEKNNVPKVTYKR